MNKPQKIRWLIAHEPVELFLRTAEAFAEKLAELTDNRYEVEIINHNDYQAQMDKNKWYLETRQDAKRIQNIIEMDRGNIDMSQVYVNEIGRSYNPDFLALELPFLFKDHDHATRVFEGEIGKKLLSDLADKSPATGLAFTYSGGFRCIISKNEISGIEDFKGAEFLTDIGPVQIELVESIGAVPIPVAIRDLDNPDIAKKTDSAEMTETTIPRYLALLKRDVTSKKYVTNTKHSLFLTSIIISNQFWNALDKDMQDKFNQASLYAASLERSWSVNEANEFAANTEEQNKLGVNYSELSNDDVEKFKELVMPVYDKCKDLFQVGLVDGIIRA